MEIQSWGMGGGEIDSKTQKTSTNWHHSNHPKTADDECTPIFCVCTVKKISRNPHSENDRRSS